MKARVQDHAAAVEAWFQGSFRERGELGASLSVWQDGAEVISLHRGHANRERSRPWTESTLVPVWSATKGPAAVACLMALHEAGLPLDSPVAEAWPEFVGGGKADITFAQLLAHRAGLCALEERVPVVDYDGVIRAIEGQAPLWPAGACQAYHPRTIGFMLDEIVRRLTGADSLGEYFREAIGSPLGLDFWIGLPRAQHERVATIYPGKMSLAARDQPFLKALATPGSLTRRAFGSPVGLGSAGEFNQPDAWTRGYPAMGGIGSARALGQFYSVLAEGGRGIVPAPVAALLEHPLSEGEDAVLHSTVAFGPGVMLDPVDAETAGKTRSTLGPSLRAFGHPGAGGSLGFADPENKIAFAYVMNQLDAGALPGEKTLGLVRAVYGM